MLSVTPTSRATLAPLSIVASDDDPDTFVVGPVCGGQFVELPTVGRDAVELLAGGLTVAEVEDRLDDGDERPDVVALVEDMIELGWLESLDGATLGVPAADRRGHLPWLRRGHVDWLFGRPVRLAAAALVLAAMVTMIRRPELVPSFHDFFWTDYVGLATLGNTLLFVLGGSVHELMHLAAARSLGVPARIGLGTRLTNLAFQTDVSAAWTVPRRQRYRIYLAGMAWDVVSMSVSVLVLAYAEPPPLLGRLLAAYVLVGLVSLLLQAQVYMRTDLYFVLMDVLHSPDLFHDGLRYARSLPARMTAKVRRRRAPVDPLWSLPPAQARAVRVYTPLLVMGSAAALLAYALFAVPVLVLTTVTAVRALAALPSGSVPAALDGALVLTVEAVVQVTFLVTFARSHPAWSRRRFQRDQGRR